MPIRECLALRDIAATLAPHLDMDPGKVEVANAPTWPLRVLNQHLEVCVAYRARKGVEVCIFRELQDNSP